MRVPPPLRQVSANRLIRFAQLGTDFAVLAQRMLVKKVLDRRHQPGPHCLLRVGSRNLARQLVTETLEMPAVERVQAAANRSVGRTVRGDLAAQNLAEGADER
ncbi:hypothetical protein GCM10009565_51960 [Amycolatopsis albidoflavus]